MELIKLRKKFMNNDLISDLVKESNYVKFVAVFSLIISFLNFITIFYLFKMVQK